MLLTGIETKWRACTESQYRVFTCIEINGGLSAFDRTRLHRIQSLKAGHQFTRRKCLDLEFAVSDIGQGFGQHIGGTENHIKRFREARGQPPFNLRIGLGNGRGCDCRGRHGTGYGKQIAAIDHGCVGCHVCPPVFYNPLDSHSK